MPFPQKFRSLIEIDEKRVDVPDYVWLSFAVCAVEESSCGWSGWILESAWKAVANPTKEIQVVADVEQRCPVCNKLLYRTAVEKQYRLNRNAEPKIPYNYESAPIKFSGT